VMSDREGPFLKDMGAAVESLGLVAFAAVCWWFIPRCARRGCSRAQPSFGGSLPGCTWVIRKRCRRTF
jgi:hypothetical protein